MHPKVKMFLLERERAYERNDVGVIHSMNAELRRLNIPDDATFANPTGKSKSRGTVKSTGRPKLPRCEHENVVDRCEICNPELAAK